MNTWDQIRNYLQARISTESYTNWLAGTSLLDVAGDHLTVSVPDRETLTWLETEYSHLVQRAIHELQLGIRRVSYEAKASNNARNQVPLADLLDPQAPSAQ